MKKVLYITNIEVPYRVKFFNQLAEKVDLTVLYERKKSTNRNNEWAKSEQNKYVAKYLHGIKIKNENSFSLGIIKEVFSKKYDEIIIGCYNSPVQIFAIMLMKLFHKKYSINLDGEPYINDSFKDKIKKIILRKADKYLVAGEKSAKSLQTIIQKDNIYPYYFSSLTQEELEINKRKSTDSKRDNYIIVIGQYFDYKGLDLALEIAKKTPKYNYKFIGMGNRTELFNEKVKEYEINNIELIPFLQKNELEKEYLSCKLLLLPSRQECWGLVINEAASYGTPIVSSRGSGSGVEFLEGTYSKYLYESNDIEKACECIKEIMESKESNSYSQYLLDEASEYSIERNVEEIVKALEK